MQLPALQWLYYPNLLEFARSPVKCSIARSTQALVINRCESSGRIRTKLPIELRREQFTWKCSRKTIENKTNTNSTIVRAHHFTRNLDHWWRPPYKRTQNAQGCVCVASLHHRQTLIRNGDSNSPENQHTGCVVVVVRVCAALMLVFV